MAHDLRPYLRADVTASTPSGALVVTCAALGSPASELARVVDVPHSALVGAVCHGEPLHPFVVELVSRWLSCVWWRTLWRLGMDEGNDEAEMELVADLAATLPAVPDDWAADLARALILGERRPRAADDPREPGRAVLTLRAAEQIRAAYAGGQSLRKLAKQWRVSASTIHKCVTGRSW